MSAARSSSSPDAPRTRRCLRELAISVAGQARPSVVILGRASDGSANLVAAVSKDLDVDARELLDRSCGAHRWWRRRQARPRDGWQVDAGRRWTRRSRSPRRRRRASSRDDARPRCRPRIGPGRSRGLRPGRDPRAQPLDVVARDGTTSTRSPIRYVSSRSARSSWASRSAWTAHAAPRPTTPKSFALTLARATGFPIATFRRATVDKARRTRAMRVAGPTPGGQRGVLDKVAAALVLAGVSSTRGRRTR